MLHYKSWQTDDKHPSTVHLLWFRHDEHQLRAVPAGPDFPLSAYFRDPTNPKAYITPPMLAQQAGALACVGGDFMATVWDRLGFVTYVPPKIITGQPIHALVIDREIWTTGRRGMAYYGGGDLSHIDRNKIRVKVWINGESYDIDSVNRGHSAICAFTARGGTNEFARHGRGKTFILLGAPGPWESVGISMRRRYTVRAVMERRPPLVAGDEILIETRVPMPGAKVGEWVGWVQTLGYGGVSQVVGGLTELVRDGKVLVNFAEGGTGISHGPDNPYRLPNPRTAIGISEGGLTTMLVAVEGRIEESRGVRLKELACIMREQGAYAAFNMDGGGSTHMWMADKGLVANSCYGDGTIEDLRPNVYATCVL